MKRYISRDLLNYLYSIELMFKIINGFVNVQQDTVRIIAYYKSYWTGNIVTDAANVFPLYG